MECFSIPSARAMWDLVQTKAPTIPTQQSLTAGVTEQTTQTHPTQSSPGDGKLLQLARRIYHRWHIGRESG
ncbi:hypothetical protein FSARC_834 [Fusarium sarcochroum]|uniref:Uncharacterized protein n=1 Tax=Fusarium sarcochroum TaxID=1208366 RepID=A0A8H4UAM5_9HYPO|nr:hypothetical protein FSARC_834 [Fusarium sarcochroum]